MYKTKKKILLVEDQKLLALSESMMLISLGYDIVIASSGEEAIDRINEGEEFDLILVDTDLQTGLSGAETASVILCEHNIPLIFIIPPDNPEVIRKTGRISHYGYLIKNRNNFLSKRSIELILKLNETNTKRKQKKN